MEHALHPAEVARQTARFLLDVGAVRLRPEQPFQWASGWKSPIYCDNRVTLSDPAVRQFITRHLAALVRQHYPQAGAVAGVATAGIPQGVLVAEALELPFLYVRPKPKEHGMGNQIEGRLAEGQQVVVVEDLISTGGSSLRAVEALRAAGAGVLGMVAIFTYGFPQAEANFLNARVELQVLSHYEALLGEALAGGQVQENQLGTLSHWRKSPETWDGKANNSAGENAEKSDK